jgi:hypothetical protein
LIGSNLKQSPPDISVVRHGFSHLTNHSIAARCAWIFLRVEKLLGQSMGRSDG